MNAPSIVAWHERMVASEEPLPLEIGTKIVFGCPLWHAKYIDNFLGYCLPSILSEYNRNALDAAGWEFVMLVDEEAEAKLKAAGAPAKLVRMPDDIAALMHAQPEYKYQLLTAFHNLLIHKARDIGAGFHMMTADCTYSNRYFERTLDLGSRHDAIADTGLVISTEAAFPVLDKFKKGDGSLDISARALSYVGYNYMAPAWKAWSMDGITDFEQMPNSHYIHVRGQRSMRVYCAHKNVAWLSNERCRKVERHLGGTVDSELPRYVAGGFYTPTIEDEMCAASFSHGAVPFMGWGPDDQPPMARCGWDEYQRNFWAFIGGKDERPRENRFLPYFVNPNVFPVPEDPEAPDDAELDERLGRLMERLYA